MAHNFLTKRSTPCSGSRTNLRTGPWVYLGEREKAKLDKMREISILSSTVAKFCPRHTRGPTPNGMYRCGNLQAPVIPFSNLSGLNLKASGPHMSGSVCNVHTMFQMLTPFGTLMSPNFMSLKTSLDIIVTGG